MRIGQLGASNKILLFPPKDRSTHFYICGATGTGKSKFLESLIWQDIMSAFDSGCGMLLLDPHGSLYDSIMRRITAKDISTLPIIPIDLRHDDWVVGYNAMRRRDTASRSVVVDHFVDAIAHAWGASNTDATPRFNRWSKSLLSALYDNELTLLESTYLADKFGSNARREIMRNMSDRAAKDDLEFLNCLSRDPQTFENATESTINRFRKFVNNPYFEAIFGQTEVSLNLREALDKGHIILVSLATENAKASADDARMFATLLLSDLWMAATERGKREGVKPFYVYVDEFQEFVTPTIAKNLAQARGFGLHFTLANQFPQQILNQGGFGKALYDEIMTNARSKAVFAMDNPEHLKPLAEWLYTGVLNPNEIKHEIHSTKVMGHREETRTSYSESTTESAGGSMTTTTGSGSSHGETIHPLQEGDEWNGEAGNLEYVVMSSSDQDSESSSEGRTWSEAHTSGTTMSSVFIPELGKELSSIQYRDLDEQLHRAMVEIFRQDQRQAMVRLVGMKGPVQITTPFMDDLSKMDKKLVRKHAIKLLKKWKFALPRKNADKKLIERRKKLELKFAAPQEEPVSARRKTKSV